MTAGRDDDALTWEGDDDPTLDTGVTRETPAASTELPEGFTAVGRGAETLGRDSGADTDAKVAEPAADATTDTGDPRRPMGNAALISLGVLGGIYLLFSIGWLVGSGRLSLIAQLFLDPIAFQVTVVLAILAPPLWFGTTLLLTRRSRAWVRFTVLAVGAVLLIPWPFVLAGALL